MADEGITTGTAPTAFSPDGVVSRGEAATFLYRFMRPSEATADLDSTECTRELRIVLERGGLTPSEAMCAAPYLTAFDAAYLLDVVLMRTDTTTELILAAVSVGNRCLTADRITELSRLSS